MQRQLDALHDTLRASDARISAIVADTQAQLDELRALIGKKPAPASAKPVLPLSIVAVAESLPCIFNWCHKLKDDKDK